MAFQYPLENLLKLQKSVEHQEENRLMICAGRVARLRKDLEGIRTARSQRKNQTILELGSGVVGIVVQMAMEWDEAMNRIETAAKEKLISAEELRMQQMTAYKAARQKREVLEGLRDKLKSEYDVEEVRRVQQGLDDMFLLRTFFWKQG
jgi:flagellar biosynthesis chaperone FliJ